MSHRPVLTRRLPALDDETALRRMVAASLEWGAADQGRGLGGWLEDVTRLHATVTSLSASRRAGASEHIAAALRERVSVAMILVMPVYRSASDHLSQVLSAPDMDALRALRWTLSEAGIGPVDPWLHRPVTDTVNDALAARISPLRLQPAA